MENGGSFYKIRILLNSVEEAKIYDFISGDSYLGDFLRNFGDGKYATQLEGDNVLIKISETDSFQDKDLFIAPDATLSRISNGFNIRSIQYEIRTKSDSVSVNASSRNAFSVLMHRQPCLLPPRDIKQQSGPKLLWNKIVDWIEDQPNARFKNDEQDFMLKFMHTVFDVLW